MLQRRRATQLTGPAIPPLQAAGPGAPAPGTEPGGSGMSGDGDTGRPARSCFVTAERSDPAHVPPLPIQLNALQALCRQLFGFRLAMTVLAAPFALTKTEPGFGQWLTGAAVLATVMVSYVLLRDWERFGPVLLRHPVLLAADMLFGALLLFTASPNSTLGIVSICTPLLAGLVYSWRGAGLFAALQILLLGLAYKVDGIGLTTTPLLLMGLCALAGAAGSNLRGLLLRFGAASQALTETRARLAVNEAVEGERARLAREMHDSVAKTLHGVALQADALAASADRMDPMTVKHQAETLARSARRAAAESRELLSDLRRATGEDSYVDLTAELAARTDDFARRSGVAAAYTALPGPDVPPVPPPVARQLLTITGEALENAARHAGATAATVTTGIVDDKLRLSIHDNGAGLPPGTTLDGLKRAGHFGLVGMVERAGAIGARIRIGRGRHTHGTEVRVDMPLAALPPAQPTGWGPEPDSSYAAQPAPPAQPVPPARPIPHAPPRPVEAPDPSGTGQWSGRPPGPESAPGADSTAHTGNAEGAGSGAWRPPKRSGTPGTGVERPTWQALKRARPPADLDTDTGRLGAHHAEQDQTTWEAMPQPAPEGRTGHADRTQGPEGPEDPMTTPLKSSSGSADTTPPDPTTT